MSLGGVVESHYLNQISLTISSQPASQPSNVDPISLNVEDRVGSSYSAVVVVLLMASPSYLQFFIVTFTGKPVTNIRRPASGTGLAMTSSLVQYPSPYYYYYYYGVPTTLEEQFSRFTRAKSNSIPFSTPPSGQCGVCYISNGECPITNISDFCLRDKPSDHQHTLQRNVCTCTLDVHTVKPGYKIIQDCRKIYSYKEFLTFPSISKKNHMILPTFFTFYQWIQLTLLRKLQ